MMHEPLEVLEEPMDNPGLQDLANYNPAGHIPEELPLDPPLQQAVVQALPRARQPYQDDLPPHYLGHMDVLCRHCQALHWDAEKLAKSTRNHAKFGMCCLQGQ
ncbi:hypothetical protein C0992_002504, partial [Termitomyces sp. T32_za158]